MRNRKPMLLDKEYKGKEYDAEVAKELHYPDVVIAMLLNEEDEEKRQRILTDARHGKYGRR